MYPIIDGKFDNFGPCEAVRRVQQVPVAYQEIIAPEVMRRDSRK